MVLCLDKSGSMSGAPFTALLEGAKQVGRTIYEAGDFEHFETIFFDNKITTYSPKDQQSYEKILSTTHAGGSTNFAIVFKRIQEFV